MTGRLLERLALGLCLIGAAAMAALAGGGLLSTALYLALLGPLGAPAAAALTGAAVLFGGLLLLLMSRLVLREPIAVPAAIPSLAAPIVPQQTAQILSALAGEEIGRFLQEKPKSATGIALVAGLAIGLSPELRGTLGSLLAPEKR